MQDEKREQGNAAGAAFPFYSTVRIPLGLATTPRRKTHAAAPGGNASTAGNPAFGPGFDYAVPPAFVTGDGARRRRGRRKEGGRPVPCLTGERSLRTGYDRKLRARDAATDTGTEQARRVSTRSGAHSGVRAGRSVHRSVQGGRRTTARPTLRPDNVRRRPPERP